MSAPHRVEGRAGGVVEAGVVWVPPAVRPFLAVGVVAVIVGGLAAAVARPAGWEQASWSAAFLVLVVGVGQTAVAIGQSAASQGVVSARTIAAELALGNVGALFVMIGTLASSPVLATLGSLLFAAAVAVFAHQSSHRNLRRGWAHRAYVTLLVILAVSVSIGIALTWVRA